MWEVRQQPNFALPTSIRTSHLSTALRTSERHVTAEPLLFALDIGNTNVTCGLFRNAQLAASWRLSTHAPKTVDEFVVTLRDLFHASNIPLTDVGAAILCSVVPKTLRT